MPDITDYWVDGPGGGTPITAANQNAREEAIFDAATAYADSVSDKRVDLPTGYLYENMDRRGTTNSAAVGAGIITAAGWVVVRAGVAITNIVFCTGATAATSPTNQWFGLQDATNEQIVAVTSDDTTTAWSFNTIKSLPIAGGPWTPGSDMLVRGLIMFGAGNATSMGGLTGSSGANSAMQLAPKSIYRDTGTGRTTPLAVGTTLTPNSGEFRTPWFGLT